MRTLFRYLRSDFLKIKATPIVAAHLAIPVATASVFLLYYKVSPWDSFSKVQAFYQVVGMGYPFLIGAFCAIIAEQELFAGRYQALLAAEDRRAAFGSKLLLLLLLGAFSLLFTSVLFGTGYFFGMKQQVVDYGFYWTAPTVMLGGSVFLYILHLFLALRFHKGVTVGLGVAESLLSAVLMTGLGEGVWIFVPAVWANRLTGYVMFAYSAMEIPAAGLGRAALFCTIVTVVSILACGIWACRWDGVCGYE